MIVAPETRILFRILTIISSSIPWKGLQILKINEPVCSARNSFTGIYLRRVGSTAQYTSGGRQRLSADLTRVVDVIASLVLRSQNV